MRRIDHIVIHCSATTAQQDIGRHEIDAWHRERGWKGIGYHFVIRRDGALEAGRPIAQVGAHVQGHNAHSIGICMVGGVRRHAGRMVAEDNFTSAQWDTLKRLIRDLHERFEGAKIVGHRDLYRGKECPSFSVRDWLIRENVLDAGIAWDSGVDPPMPIGATKTVAGATVSGAAGLAALADTVTETATQAAPAAQGLPTLQLLLGLLIVAGVGLAIYGRISVRKRSGV